MKTCAGADTVVSPNIDESLKCGAVTIVFLFTEPLILTKVDAGQIRIDIGALVIVIFVEFQE